MKSLIIAVVIMFGCCINLSSQSPDDLWKLLPGAPANPGTRFEDMYFFDKTSGVAIDLYGKLFWFKDGDRGIRDITIENGSKQGVTRCIAFQSRAHGWIGTLDSVRPLLQSTDSGVTWRSVSLPNPKPSGICGMWALNSQVLFGCGAFDIGTTSQPFGRAVFIKTTDGGKNFTTVDMSPYALTLVDCYFVTPEKGFVTGSVDGTDFLSGHAVILSTSDGGATWKTVYKSKRTGEQGWKIYFRTPNDGYVALQSPQKAGDKFITATTDGGATWNELYLGNASMKRFPQGVCFPDAKHGIVGGYSDTVFTTSDGGNSWAKYKSNSIYLMNRSRKIDDTTAYIIASQVFEFKKEGLLSAPPAIEKNLTPPYPNPSQEDITIHIPFDGLCWVKIVDMQGNILDVIIADNYVRIPTHHLPNGEYTALIESKYGVKSEKFVVAR